MDLLRANSKLLCLRWGVSILVLRGASENVQEARALPSRSWTWAGQERQSYQCVWEFSERIDAGCQCRRHFSLCDPRDAGNMTRVRKLSHEPAVRILLLCPAAYDFLAVGGSRISSVVAFAEARWGGLRVAIEWSFSCSRLPGRDVIFAWRSVRAGFP